jgi:hypothetical protein
VVWRLDRLGRSVRHLTDTVTTLADRGVGFRSLTEGFDTTTPGGKLIFHVFAGLAEFERGAQLLGDLGRICPLGARSAGHGPLRRHRSHSTSASAPAAVAVVEAEFLERFTARRGGEVELAGDDQRPAESRS